MQRVQFTEEQLERLTRGDGTKSLSMSPQTLKFTEEEIQKLFGHEAAEDEDPARLREYYFKNEVYNQVTADLPLRIVVGHKGIGKSALFQVAMKEDVEAGKVVVLIKPDDIIGLGSLRAGFDFLQLIREWKNGLSEIIIKKVLQSFGQSKEDILSQTKHYGGLILDFLKDTFKDQKKLSLQPAQELILENFLRTNKIIVYI